MCVYSRTVLKVCRPNIIAINVSGIPILDLVIILVISLFLPSALTCFNSSQLDAPLKPSADREGSGKNFEKYDEDDRLFRKNSNDKYASEFAGF